MDDLGFSGSSRFQTTSWTLLGQLEENQEHAAAFDAICERYQKPLWVYLLRMGRKPQDAEDSVQDFFTHALSQGLLARPDREKGKFRTWLLTAFRRFCRDRDTKRHTRFNREMKPLGQETGVVEAERPDRTTAEDAFERQWAWDLLVRTHRDLETLACAKKERWKFEIFHLRCEAERKGERPRWRQWGKQVGRPDKSKDQLAYAYLQMQDEANRIFKQYVSHEFPEEGVAGIDDEVTHVWDVISQGPPEHPETTDPNM